MNCGDVLIVGRLVVCIHHSNSQHVYHALQGNVTQVSSTVEEYIYVYAVIVLWCRIDASYLDHILISSSVLIEKFSWLLEGKRRKG